MTLSIQIQLRFLYKFSTPLPWNRYSTFTTQLHFLRTRRMVSNQSMRILSIALEAFQSSSRSTLFLIEAGDARHEMGHGLCSQVENSCFRDLLATNLDWSQFGLSALNASELLLCDVTPPCTRQGWFTCSSQFVTYTSCQTLKAF